MFEQRAALFHDETRSILEVLSHLLRQYTKSDTGEVVDGETGVLWVVHWEQILTCRPYFLVFEPLCKSLQTHTLHHLLHHDLDEDTGTRCCIVLVHFDGTEVGPRYRVISKHVSKETRDVTEPVRLISMNGVVIAAEGLFDRLHPNTIEPTKPFPDEAVKCRVRTLLRTTLDNHVDEFDLLSFLELNLQKLVDRFFVVESVHNSEVYHSS